MISQRYFTNSVYLFRWVKKRRFLLCSSEILSLILSFRVLFFIIVVSIHIYLTFQHFIFLLWALKYVTIITETYLTSHISLILKVLQLHVVFQVVSILEHFFALGTFLLPLRGFPTPIDHNLISYWTQSLRAKWTIFFVNCHLIFRKNRENFLVQTIKNMDGVWQRTVIVGHIIEGGIFCLSIRFHKMKRD